MTVLVVSAPSLGGGPALPVEPVETVEALPAATAAEAWIRALHAEGGRLPPDFVATVSALHPFRSGQWHETFYTEVAGVGGSVHLSGTFELEAVGLAEAHIRLVPPDGLAPPEAWAWHRWTRKVKAAAQQTIAGRVTTPAMVTAAVEAGLLDERHCHRHLDALAQSSMAGVGDVVQAAKPGVPEVCTPKAIGVLAHASPSDTFRPAAFAWFRTAWADATPAGKASLMKVLSTIPDPPSDLAMRLEDAAVDARAEARARHAAEQLRAVSPVLCMDGRVDPDCRCADPPTQCCVHHGGVDRCLPPPP